MRTRTAAAFSLAAVLALGACSSGPSKSTATKSSAAPTPTADKPAAELAFGKPAETVGSGGTGRLEVTPTSIVYVTKALIDKPSKGLFAVVTVKDRATTAVAAEETAPIMQGGWQWIAPDGQAIATGDGTADMVSIEGFKSGGAVQPGAFRWESRVFDISEKQRGGTLVYTDGAGKSFRWKTPAQDAGPQVEELKKALAE
ncbi:hypothetical protein [Streptomyces aureoversilis]|uniref:Lipoprotein n=1 Tax=Streptomyces aureoversilis TaxID=67277 RepID=A0ABV9ZSD4_9ACTN